MTELEKILEAIGGEKRIDYSLERFQAALNSIGNPEKTVKTIVIAGTNGKGTCTLLISASLIEAGFKVGTYLSPHLESVTERFLHNLENINENTLQSLAIHYYPIAQKHSLTYFEFLTLLYFIWAKEQKFDFSVLECGLGGRLDATNVTNPIASLITNIDFDHEAYLGNSLEKILREKLGILRKEALLFTGVTENSLLKIIDDRCLELDAIPYYSKEIKKVVQKSSPEGQEITLNGYPFCLTNPSVGSVENAALAFLMMRIIFPKIPITKLQNAFRKVKTPGRMEIVQEQPRVVLSGDHNLAGIKCLTETLDRIGIKKPKILCAFSPDKPYEKMFDTLKNLSSQITLTSITRLKDSLPETYFKMGEYIEKPEQALKKIIEESSRKDTILVTGSLYLIGEIRKMFSKTNDSLLTR